ncbi:hypothetical protein [Nocardia sp. alder85J]|uniref:hypothetical protein n=1 Tax=Nocardia sp. alder85J TaxID=2862949 RepID=UPI00225774A1|nr:hypothetical protein [Nocardia sp. alder85J]MCX4094545.1 hypothetical protein [Nocardia sp. alder85J]
MVTEVLRDHTDESSAVIDRDHRYGLTRTTMLSWMDKGRNGFDRYYTRSLNPYTQQWNAARRNFTAPRIFLVRRRTLRAVPQTFAVRRWTAWPAFYTSGIWPLLTTTERQDIAHIVQTATIWNPTRESAWDPIVAGFRDGHLATAHEWNRDLPQWRMTPLESGSLRAYIGMNGPDLRSRGWWTPRPPRARSAPACPRRSGDTPPPSGRPVSHIPPRPGAQL